MDYKIDNININGIQGIKGINFDAWGGIEGFLMATSGGGAKAGQLKRIVPWLAKAASMTANAISSLPFEILDDKGAVYDKSNEWKNNLGGMPNPKKLLKLIALSLCGGRAYVIPTTINQAVTELHYCAPHTVTELITNEGLVALYRTSENGVTGNYTPAGIELQPGQSGEMLYFWLPDSDVEIGPAKTFPMSTALLSTELLMNMDATLKTYSERGFVPPTLMAVKGMVNPGERDKAERWWNQFLRGWSKTVAKIMNAEAMDIKQVGAGFAELRTVYHDLTRQQIENIGASHGIPGALFMSDMAFASEFNPMIKFWYSTSEFVSIYQCIEETFTDQLLARYGKRFVFKPETIDAFQEDEGKRSTAYATYCNAGMRPSIAGEIMSLELPEGMDYDELDEKFDEPPPVPVVMNQTPPVEKPDDEEEEPEKPGAVQLDAQQIKDLDLWRQVAVRNHSKNKGNAVDFVCKSVPDYMSMPIREKLKNANNELEILKAFEITGQSEQTDAFALLDGIRNEVMAIKMAKPQPVNVTVNNTTDPTPVNVKVDAPIVNVPPAQVTVTNEVNPTPVTVENTVKIESNMPDESKDVVKAIRKLAREK